MKRIRITRDSGGKVKFDEVWIDNTETVFFINLDEEQPHKPSILKLQGDEQLGPSPSDPSSQCPVPVPQVANPNPPPPTKAADLPYKFIYGCDVPGHDEEEGTINVFAQLAPDKKVLKATVGQPTNQRVVKGGKPPYTIGSLIVNNANVPGTSTGPAQQLPIGLGLQLGQDDKGISVVGTPAQANTYNFTFEVDDSMGRNLQQIQYSLTVS